MNESDYEDYLDEEYDLEENPLMALGQSMAALPGLKNYAHQFNLQQLKPKVKPPNAKSAKLFDYPTN